MNRNNNKIYLSSEGASQETIREKLNALENGLQDKGKIKRRAYYKIKDNIGTIKEFDYLGFNAFLYYKEKINGSERTIEYVEVTIHTKDLDGGLGYKTACKQLELLDITSMPEENEIENLVTRKP